MTTIVELDVNNYRGIKKLNLVLEHDKRLVCIIGRGDSGKTTILESISAVLSPSWNLAFSDEDFYNGELSKDIEISLSIVDFPDKYLADNNYGLHVRSLDLKTGKIEDDVTVPEVGKGFLPVLTIKLTVDSFLEPKWVVTCNREIEDKPISAKDRANLNCFLISDYIDKHFSWNRGSPLNAILNLEDTEGVIDDNVIIEQLRKAKAEIDKNNFIGLDDATKRIIEQAEVLGINASNIRTTLDSKDLLVKSGKIVLHDESVPYRLKGKGTKRLTSIAIQSILVRKGGIMLVDEIEQGLEPDRVKQAVRALDTHDAGQIFLTTHSREVITELGSQPLLFVLRNELDDSIETRLFSERELDLQKTVRACPEAFFAKKVIVCEGATEIGICRAIDKWRGQTGKSHMALLDCAYVDGVGNTIDVRVDEIEQSGIQTAIFCDSDLPKINEKKEGWASRGVAVFDCDEGLCLEQQLFKDLPWQGVLELLNYASAQAPSSFEGVFIEQKGSAINDWKDTKELRTTIMSKFKPSRDGNLKRDWFKQQHHGEKIGDVLFEHFNYLDSESSLYKTISGISNWIDS
ncbi:ATP-binding protein [Vibrio natriegens]|uniref:ATP-dependent nuclease n=1 Tax=Vibrio natriegens TaxID=691 RepID=UPI002284B2BA|nr:ATP-binding protein [Vibrio natriegens]ELA9308260.1 ATP-binding protein [Vibrio parahaemolyticus]MCY9875372.1 ATP-binding protein [Vibrio natriegens]